MASLSSSNGSGSGVMAPGTGILLNNMLGEEDLNPGGFGRTSPGARMTSMMAPSLLLRDGEPVMALGSAGSNRLRTASLQTVVNLVDAGMDVPEAVRYPRVHPEGDGVDVEGGVPEEVVAALLADGHHLRRWGETNLFFGGVSAAGVAPQGLQAAGDPRRGGGATAVTASGELIDL
jgi:gamma-glutamyltranspeptidase/glutathione hydrolase